MIEPLVPEGRRARNGLVRAVDGIISLVLLSALTLTIAGISPPRYDARIDPAAIGFDGGHAFTFPLSLGASWLYVVPSHPHSVLSLDDVQVMEDGRSIGSLQPDHEVIRREGGGLLNLWQGTLWFSPRDDTDPRSNGRVYDVRVKSRLAPAVSAARTLSWTAFAALLLGRLSPVAVRRSKRVGRALDRHLGLGHLARWIPLTFGRAFALAGAAALGSLALGFLRRPMPVILEADSLGYIGPGLVWAAGGDMTGQSVRDVGYPFLTLVAVRLGSLSTLPQLQLSMVIAGLACLLTALYLGVTRLAARIRARTPGSGWILAVAGAFAALGYVALLSGHDLFMLDIDSAMAEAPHVLPCALALLFFLGALVAGNARARVAMLAVASLAAYTSAMFKPHSLLVLALCLVGFVVASAFHRRALASPAVVVVCAACLVCAAVVYRFDGKVTPPGQDFGPKTLFCNHLDVIGPVFDEGSPPRRHIATLLRELLARPDGWPIMGFNGDGCMYGAEFDAALVAVSREEGMTPAKWEQRQFVEAVFRNPVGYSRAVARQLWAYFSDPTNGVDATVRGSLTDQDWQALERLAKPSVLPADRSQEELHNWVPRAYPLFGTAVKATLGIIRTLFAPVALGSALLALIAQFRLRGRADLRPEIVLVGTAVFTLAFAATTMLAHTFDVARYATDLLPFSLLWWILGVAYLGHLAVLAGAAVCRRASAGSATDNVPSAEHTQ